MVNKTNVVVIGGGFGGIRAALDIAKQNPIRNNVTLITDRPWFEYNLCSYRVVASTAPFGVSIPFATIFDTKPVKVVEDVVVDADLENQVIEGSSGEHYQFDILILALGSEVNFHGIPFIRNLTFAIKTIENAVELSAHIDNLFSAMEKAEDEAKVTIGHIVIVGGGPTGIEVAGALAARREKLALKGAIDPSFVTIDILDSGKQIAKRLSRADSRKIHKRLRELDVNIFLNRPILSENSDGIYFEDLHLQTKTLVLAAGLKPNALFSKIKGLSLDQDGRVLVDEFLHARDYTNVFVIGDGASDPYSGMAQTAINQGRFVAQFISRTSLNKKIREYTSRKTSFAIPVGPNWAFVVIGPLKFHGRLGYLLRRLADFRFLLSILTFKQAVHIFFRDDTRSIDIIKSQINRGQIPNLQTNE